MEIGRICLLLGTAALLNGCANGPLYRQSHEIHFRGRDGRDACDRMDKRAQERIAIALDEREREIATFAARSGAAGDGGRIHGYGRVAAGPTYFLKRAEGHRPASAPRAWTAMGWRELQDWYDEIRHKPVDAEWLDFNESARNRLSDDRRRVYLQLNYYVGRSSRPALERLRSAVLSCLDADSCDTLSLDREAMNLVLRVPFYRFHWQRVRDGKLGFLRRGRMREFLARIERDHEALFGFERNDTVRRASEELLEVPLDIGPFRGSEELLAGFVEDAWSGPRLRVRVRWVEATGSNGVYRLSFDASPGGRSHTSSTWRKVVLHAGDTQEDIAHEIGHVLGLPDRYEAIRDAKSCSYRMDSDGDSVMGSGSKASDEELAELDRQYPFRR